MTTLNEKVQVYSKAQTRNADGSLDNTRTLITTEYMEVRAMSGSERSRNEGREDYANYRFTCHRRTDINENHILRWNSTDFNITFIADNGPRAKYMYIDAERGGAM